MANEYLNMAELIKDYYDKPVGEYLNRTVTINNVELACDIYRVTPETVLTPAVFTGCTAVDANTQIIVGKDMSVASGTTLIPPYRCKGIIIGDVGTFTNEGTISMTARGAVGEGKNIQLTASYMISAVGGAGGTGAAGSGGSPVANVFSCGGGGSGSAYGSTTTGTGGSGTSFSGGAGSGGNASTSGTTQNGSSEGGIGSNGKASAGLGSGYDGYASGGVGNPSGTSATSTGRVIPQSPSGTGGLLVVLCSSFVNTGTMEAKGVTAARAYTTTSGLTYLSQDGGSSGGGCILVLTKNSSGSGTITALGGQKNGTTDGTPGGAGGTGTQEILIVEDLILQNLPVEFAITDKVHLDNIEPSEAVRFIGLTDDDELHYDIMGKRHRAMNTDVDLSVIHAPGTTHNATDGSPVGTIISFFGYSAPSGYLACDGTEYAKADYPYLATHLADLDDHYSTTTYVGSDSDHFKVPDLRGEFLRGTGTNGHTDQGDGANVGIHQDSTRLPDYGVLNNGQYVYKLSNAYGIANTDKVIKRDILGWYLNSNLSGSSTSDVNVLMNVRPTNTSVLYCIKYN